MQQQDPSSTPVRIRIRPPALLNAQLELDNGDEGEYLAVTFRPRARERFNALFKPAEQRHVLELLLEQLDAAITVEEGAGIPLKQLTVLAVRFRFVDLRVVGCILIESLYKDGDEPPSPPARPRSLRDAVVSGGVSGLVRWVLGQLFGKLFTTGTHVFPAANDISASDEQGLQSLRTDLQVLLELIWDSENQRDTFDSEWVNRGVYVGVESPTFDEDSWSVQMSAGTTVPSITEVESPLKTSTTVVEGELLTTFHVPISRVVDIKSIRSKLGMTQEVFAQTFGLSLASLRNWEQGTRTPERPISLYLRLIEKYPKEVQREVEAMRSGPNSGD